MKPFATWARTLAGVALLFGLGAAAPHPTDFAVAAEFAAGLLAAETPRRQGASEPTIVTGAQAQSLSLAEYRRQRSECLLNRLIRIQGRSEIGAEWRCGPLNARWYDVYTVEERQVARVQANVPLLVTSPTPDRR